MTGLRPYRRDADLPAAAGQPELVPPSTETVRGLVAEHLLQDPSCEVGEARWEYARWKPGTSTTSTFSIAVEERSRLVTVKRYSSEKARHVASKLDRADRFATSTAPLAPWAIHLDEGMVLSVFPADRELPGLGSLLDGRWTARALADAGWCPPRSVRRRRLAHELLRYKPERRAVLALDVELRPPAAEPHRRRLAARVLPPGAIARVTRNRLLFGAHANSDLAARLGPELVFSDRSAGLLVETWLDVAVTEPCRVEGFERSSAVGELLGRLHSVHHGRAVVCEDTRTTPELALFAGHPELAREAAGLAQPRSSAQPVWRHGDFHPDQVGERLDGSGLALLDLDELAVGDPLDDLASWVADHLALDPRVDFQGAAEPLLDGYHRAGGERVASVELAHATASALGHRAAAAFRRLEEDAPAHAERLLERAVEVMPPSRESCRA